MYGSVTVAEAHARSALAITEEAALPLGRMTLVAMLARLRSSATSTRPTALASLTMTPELERVISGSDLIGVRAELHRLRGRLDEAERDARRARELVRARGWTTPLSRSRGFRLAETLIDARRDDEGHEPCSTRSRPRPTRAGTRACSG